MFITKITIQHKNYFLYILHRSHVQYFRGNIEHDSMTSFTDDSNVQIFKPLGIQVCDHEEITKYLPQEQCSEMFRTQFFCKL